MNATGMRRTILSLSEEVARLRRIVARSVRFGTVSEVDHERARARLLISDPDGEDFKTPWLPWAETAGAIRSWAPPSVGQQMIVQAPNGDLMAGMLIPATFSDAIPAPSKDAGTYMVQVGQTSITIADGRIDINGVDQVIIKGETLRLEGNVEIVGDEVTHNGVNIGDSHLHGGVRRGTELTDPPTS